jgi:hypothetical protein
MASKELEAKTEAYSLEKKHLMVDSEEDGMNAKRVKLSTITGLTNSGAGGRGGGDGVEDEGEDEAINLCIKFVRTAFKQEDLPKSLLLEYCKGKGLELPSYTTFHVEKSFYSIVAFDGKKYFNSYLEKNKKFAEQGAALVATYEMGLLDRNIVRDCFVKDLPHEKTLDKFPHKM